MTNTIAFILAALIIGFFALDHYVLQWGLPEFAMRKLTIIIENLAVWR